MSFGPGYGETHISTDELDALLASVRGLLHDPVTKAEVYDLEQAIHEDTTAALLIAVLRGDVVLDD